MSQEPSHPLLSLPDDEIIEKIKTMDPDEIIEFSLISERSKNLVKSTKIQAIKVHIDIKSGVVVLLEFERSWCEMNFKNINSTDAPLEVELLICVGFRAKKKTIQKDRFEYGDWIKHLFAIYIIQGIDSITFKYNSLEYNPVDIKNYFGDSKYSKLIVEDTENHAHDQLVLQTFLPVDSLKFSSTVFQNSQIPREILIQNFESLEIVEGDVTLNDLLMMNSTTIEIRRDRMVAKDINKFIKLWQQGANPQMEFLRYYNGNETKEDDEENIMKGIKFTKIPKAEKRWFNPADPHDELICVEGGMDIFRKDGVRATISLFFGMNWLRMFVWFDQCTVLYEPEMF